MKDLVLVHEYLDTGFRSIVAFSDSFDELENLMINSPGFGSNSHNYFICINSPSSFIKVFLVLVSRVDCVFSFHLDDSVSLKDIKDSSLLKICENVAEYLSIAEYSMLKKSFFKSTSWFEKAKNYANFGALILENY